MQIDGGTAFGGGGGRSAAARGVLPALALWACTSAPAAAQAQTDADRGRTVVLSNGSIRIGVDPEKGGAITYLARAADGRNVVNDHDLGRQIQQSYYSGPKPFGHPIGVWAQFGWNPIASGDFRGRRAQADVRKLADGTLYVRSTPLQWALDNVPCECRFESWIRLDGNRARVHQRLTNRRGDATQYPADSQEVPAVYVNGFLRRIATYTGARPFTGDAIDRPAATWPTRRIIATENWVALVDAQDRGIGVINTTTATFDVGVSGDRDGGEHDDVTGYISPRRSDILDHDIVYDTSYTLVLGSVAEIRAAAVASRPDPRPAYVFRRDRQGWTYVNARDAGWPIAGRLRVTATQDDPQMFGPSRAFAAGDVPTLYVTAAFTGGDVAQLFWSTADAPGFNELRSIKLPVQGDGTMRTIAIPTGGAPGWTGLITGLRFDPPGGTGARADVCAIAWRAVAC